MTSRTLRRRLVAFFAPMAVGSLVAVGVVTVAELRVHDAQRQVTTDLFRAYSLSAELTEAVLHQEAGFRGYALSGDALLLERYRKGRTDEATILRQLAAVEPDIPELASRRRAVARQAEAWRAAVVEPGLTKVRNGQAFEADEVRAGKREFDEVRAALEAYQASVLDARRQSLQQLESARNVLFLVMGLGLLVLLLAAVMLWFAMRRWVIEPLERLGAEVGRVHGDLSHKVAVSSAPVEITVLAEQVDRMRLRILEEYSLVLQARADAMEAHRLVEEQAEELQRSNAELEQFAYVASHDLQEPLRKVASFCQLLERRYRDQLDDRGVQYIDFAVDGAKRMQQLINDLLAFSRVGRTTSDFVPIDLEDVLAQALRQLEVVTNEAGATVTADPLPTVDGDPSLLAQLFQNLVGNAVKFRGDEPPRVHVGVARVGDSWEFCCTDNGIGIEPQYAEKIFVIFQRLHGRDAYGGTGIGLAMCKKIVEHHNGTMWLDITSAGRGATFRWTLPVRSPADEDGVAGAGQPNEYERNAR
ncbi:MAG: ATP-binding protein [Chloroflexota bacterium]|nr:ATP-binding protein [Chloroflexota bacterium]